MQRTAPTATSHTQPTPFANQHRAALAAAIAARDADQARHFALEAALERAKEERRTATDLLRDAETKLERIKADNSTRIAYAFLNQEPDFDAVGPAEAVVEQARANLTRIEQIEEALGREIQDVESRLRTRHTSVKQALANVITTSPEFQVLFDERDKAWTRLRTLCVLLVKSAMSCVVICLMTLRRRFMSTEPLEKDIGYDDEGRYVPYEWDHELVATWQPALTELQQDAHATLPEKS